ncbi:Neutral alpha-glucosidase AB [Tritrichomonas foetus]|uniref:Maltase n=1 Tax=Tritrichomonas foetus TaxID=1144522 RepID=A0A1J4KVF9_9EUKA|nr:Neutral alpha-glucosidase AB [Tritrichomonas foetus]|eukprot:OHT13501.1 Neutral alpha-glucosidase AB [Tritrichomonas foetus]
MFLNYLIMKFIKYDIHEYDKLSFFLYSANSSVVMRFLDNCQMTTMMSNFNHITFLLLTSYFIQMFFLFAILGICSRSCKDMRFCRENINRTSKWAINESTVSFSENVFSANILENDQDANLSLQIHWILNNGIRVNIKPRNKENFTRFNIVESELFINNSIINHHYDFTFEKEDKYYTLKTKENTVKIVLNPLTIKIVDKKQSSIVINGNQQLLFEHNGTKLDSEDAGGYIDYFKNGATGVGLDFEFPGGQKTRLTGFDERKGTMNIEDSPNLFRVGNVGTLSNYGHSTLVYAHSPSEMIAMFWMNPTDTFVKVETVNQTSEINNHRKMDIISEGGYIDFVVFTGEFKEIIESYTELTGKIELPPMFTLVYHQCKWGYKNETIVNNVIHGLNEINFPFDAIWLDIDHLKGNAPFTVNEELFPHFNDIINDLNKDNRYLVRINGPHLPKDCNHNQYQEASNLNYFMYNNDGKTPFVGYCRAGNSSWPDYYNNNVREWWSKQYNYSVEKVGTASNVFFWNDVNEPSVHDYDADGKLPKDSLHFDGIEDRELFNTYGLFMTEATHRGIIEREIGKRPFLLTRSWFSGSQKYSWTWSGDNDAKFSDFANSISLTINSGLGGMPLTGSDVGGFFGNPSTELLTRWFQLGSMLYPFFREHASYDSKSREPFLYSQEEQEIMLTATKLRYQMIPLWYTSIYRTSKTGIPPVQPLFTIFPDYDDRFHDNSQLAIIGESLLVAPVLEEGSTSKEILKPPGLWYSLYDGQKLDGNKILVDINSLPLYIRGGKIISTYNSSSKNVYETSKMPLNLLIAVNENGYAEGELYLDDGETYGYTKNKYLHQFISYDNGVLSFKSLNENGDIPDKIITNNYICQITIYGEEENKKIIDYNYHFVNHNDRRRKFIMLIIIVSIVALLLIISIIAAIVLVKKDQKQSKNNYDPIIQ